MGVKGDRHNGQDVLQFLKQVIWNLLLQQLTVMKLCKNGSKHMEQTSSLSIKF